MVLLPPLTFSDIVGVWNLTNILFTNGTLPNYNYTVDPPFGRIIITEDNYFNAMISDLPVLPAGVTWATATEAQKGVIGDPLTVYEGVVKLVPFNGLWYTHTQVEASYDPEWEILQIRQANLTKCAGKPDVLTLTPWEGGYPPEGGLIGQHLVWERITPNTSIIRSDLNPTWPHGYGGGPEA